MNEFELNPLDNTFLKQLHDTGEKDNYIKQEAAQWIDSMEQADDPEDFIDERGEFKYRISDGACHGILGKFLDEFMPYTEGDRAAILMNLLIAFGNVIGRKAHFVADGQQHFLNLYAIIVGSTGDGRKGTSLRPIKQLFKSVEEDWIVRIKDGLSSGEGVIKALEDKEDETHPADKRLLIIEAEFASVLSVMRREGNTLSSMLRKAWDDGDLHILTKNNPLTATGVHLSLVGQISKEELVLLVRQTDITNGLLNRFLLVHSQFSKLLPDGGDFPKERLKHYVNELKNRVVFAKGVDRMVRDSEANEYWRPLYYYLANGARGAVGSTTARAPAQLMRMACLFALLDMSKEVRVEHLKASLLVWEYCFKTARYIFGDEKVLLNPHARKILEALKTKKELTLTEVSKLFNNNLSKEQRDKVLRDLINNGYIRDAKRTREGSKKPITIITLIERIYSKT